MHRATLRRAADPSSLASLVRALVEPARGLADDLVSVNGHPELQPGVAGILIRESVAIWARRGRLPEVRTETGKPRYRRRTW
jgi:hypothetical protein